MTQATAQSEVLARLRAAWHKERRFLHLRGLCLFLVWLVALALVSFAIDLIFELPGYLRVALILFNIAVLGWVAYRQWWRRLERYDPVTTALRVERRHPELQSLLVSYVQLRDEDGGSPAGPRPAGARVSGGQAASPTLLEAMRRQALAATRPIDFREIISYAQLRQVAIVSLIAFLLFGAVSINWRDHFRIWLNRLLNPATDLTYPRNTQLASLTGDTFLPRGGDLNLQLRATGRVPATGGTLYVREINTTEAEAALAADSSSAETAEPAPWQPLPLIDIVDRRDTPQRADRTFAYPFTTLHTGFEYYATMGDARTPVHRVSVVDPPRVAGADVTIEYPEYTDAEPSVVDSLNIETLTGSTLRWRITPDPAVRDARLLITDRDAPADATPRGLPLDLQEDGTLTADLPVDAPFTYRLAWTDAAHGFAFEDDARYAVRTRPDARPSVDLVRPRTDAIPIAPVQKRVGIQFRAEDDFGLSRGSIVFVRTTTDQQTTEPARVPIDLPGDNPADVDVQWRIADSLPDLAIGDTITYWVEVQDNFQPRPGTPAAEGETMPDASLADVTPRTAASTSRTLQIVSVPDYQAFIYDQLERKAADLRGVLHEETQADQAVEEIRRELGLPPPDTRPQSEDPS